MSVDNTILWGKVSDEARDMMDALGYKASHDSTSYLSFIHNRYAIKFDPAVIGSYKAVFDEVRKCEVCNILYICDYLDVFVKLVYKYIQDNSNGVFDLG